MTNENSVELIDGFNHNDRIDQINSGTNHSQYVALPEDSVHNHPIRGDAADYIETTRRKSGESTVQVHYS
jgi:hypothetical protein